MTGGLLGLGDSKTLRIPGERPGFPSSALRPDFLVLPKVEPPRAEPYFSVP